MPDTESQASATGGKHRNLQRSAMHTYEKLQGSNNA